MKKLLLFVLLLSAIGAKSQGIRAQIVDSASGKPLPYAIVIYNFGSKVLYSDPDGYVSFSRDSLKNNDTLSIQYLGYAKKIVAARNMYPGIVIRMIAETETLAPVIVTNCKKTVEYTLNKRAGRIKQYVGPGPETRLVVIARYNNVTGKTGIVKNISVLIDEKSPNLSIPVRIRWYEWNNERSMPGKELTDTNIIVYPYKEGWNDFEMPVNAIQCPSDWIVVGLEFIYPPQYEQQYNTLTSAASKIKWLNDMHHRWSLGMQYIDNEHERGYYIVNNGTIQSYDIKYDRVYLRPAVKLSIVVCKD